MLEFAKKYVTVVRHYNRRRELRNPPAPMLNSVRRWIEFYGKDRPRTVVHRLRRRLGMQIQANPDLYQRHR